MDVSEEFLHIKICIAKIEAARFDMLCTKQVINELEFVIQTQLCNNNPLLEKYKEAVQRLRTYVQQVNEVSLFTESNVQKSALGATMLHNLNERMPNI